MPIIIKDRKIPFSSFTESKIIDLHLFQMTFTTFSVFVAKWVTQKFWIIFVVQTEIFSIEMAYLTKNRNLTLEINLKKKWSWDIRKENLNFLIILSAIVSKIKYWDPLINAVFPQKSLRNVNFQKISTFFMFFKHF